MANARTSLKDRKAQSASGVDAIIQQTSEQSNPQSSEQSPTPTPALAKVTLYIRPDQVVAVERIQLEERVRTGSRKDKSELVQEALDLLIAKYSQ